MKICFATNNKNKLKELRHQVGNRFEILSLEDINCQEELPEEHDTLEANSAQKAQFVYDKYKIACFADDTGLLVDALHGAPGVYSARYAGLPSDSQKNMQKLLLELKNIDNRKAKFQTVITFIHPDGNKKVFCGEVNGTISRQESGSEGFGYDPIFVPENYTASFSEMPLSLKSEISHRGKAVKQLIAYLNSI